MSFEMKVGGIYKTRMGYRAICEKELADGSYKIHEKSEPDKRGNWLFAINSVNREGQHLGMVDENDNVIPNERKDESLFDIVGYWEE